MTDWACVEMGMQAARSVPDVAMQATSEEAAAAGGPDFLAENVFSPKQWDWHIGYDHAILLARSSTHNNSEGK